MNYIEHIDYVVDENNNKCYYLYFGSKEKAISALNSLVNCSELFKKTARCRC